MTEVRPYRIAVPDAVLTDLRDRLTRTRWPERECRRLEPGHPLAYTRELAATGPTSTTGGPARAALNRFDQFVTEIDGLDIHFIHQRSSNPNAFPLIITHGWPGSIVEFHR